MGRPTTQTVISNAFVALLKSPTLTDALSGHTPDSLLELALEQGFKLPAKPKAADEKTRPATLFNTFTRGMKGKTQGEIGAGWIEIQKDEEAMAALREENIRFNETNNRHLKPSNAKKEVKNPRGERKASAWDIYRSQHKGEKGLRDAYHTAQLL